MYSFSWMGLFIYPGWGRAQLAMWKRIGAGRDGLIQTARDSQWRTFTMSNPILNYLLIFVVLPVLVSGANSERIQQLEQRLLTQQEELTSLHRRRGENAQQIINLNTKLQEAEKAIQFKDERYFCRDLKLLFTSYTSVLNSFEVM